MPLAKDDKRHWRPIPAINSWLTEVVIKPSDRVLEVGPGHNPFTRADVAVDFLSEEMLQALWDYHKVEVRPAKVVQADFGVKPLPFADNEFDFVLCRHTIEDMATPEFLLPEMSRVGRAGYIETPSPLAELTRGVDGFGNCHLWRGYYHHRWVVWVEGEMLNFVGKYPMVEHLEFQEDKFEEALRRGPELWNSYYLWSGEIKWKHQQNPIDFNFDGEYGDLLWMAALESAKSTDAFCQMINAQNKRAA